MTANLIWPGLLLLGVLVGAYGTIIGAGGGFVLTPLLLLLYPNLEPEAITAVSLGVVSVNAASGAVAYGRQKRIDYLAGAVFAAATLPGAVAGALATGLFPRQEFEAAFGALLLIVALWLILPRPSHILFEPPSRRHIRRLLTDASGDTYRYAFDPLAAGSLGLVVGFISSLFGVGGGIIFVPVMILLMRFPAYIAVATSTFTLMFTAGVGSGVHLLSAHYGGFVAEETFLALGVLVGAQLGARISLRIAGRQVIVMRCLSVALIAVSLRLIFGAIV